MIAYFAIGESCWMFIHSASNQVIQGQRFTKFTCFHMRKEVYISIKVTYKNGLKYPRSPVELSRIHVTLVYNMCCLFLAQKHK